MKSITKTLENGIAYLASQQQIDGNFVSYSSQKKDDFSKSNIYKTTFFTSIILHLLNSLPENHETTEIKKRAAHFLLQNKSANWSWNYWARDAEEYMSLPYPDDLDDTFCALTALYEYDKTLIDGAAFSYVARMLIETETREGGPYKTWIVDPKRTNRWQDVDIAVNSNIGYFLSLQDITLPNMQSYFQEQIHNKKVQSPYYPSSYPLLYFLSRFYPDKAYIRKTLMQKRDTHMKWKNPLYTALAILSLANADAPLSLIEPSITYLLDTQSKGQWKGYNFCIDPKRDGYIHYAGASALTTVSCLAALHIYQTKKRQQKRKASIHTEKEYYYNTVLKNVSDSLSSYHPLVQEGVHNVVAKLVQKDMSKQIALMPYYFFETLDVSRERISKKQICALGAANMLGWVAYTIYDDFFDGEGNPELLSAANSCLRQVTSIFENLTIEEKKLNSLFHKTLNTIDGANAWEVNYCRIEQRRNRYFLFDVQLLDYTQLDQLAQKSIGHAIGPFSILYALGYKERSKEYKALYSFFMHYLIAKQLHDDAHDWEKDLAKGQVTFVVALLLKRAKEKQIIRTQSFSLGKILPRLQELFWYEVIQEVCAEVKEQVRLAKVSLLSVTPIMYPKPLLDLLQIYEDGANKALQEQKDTIAFLQNYHSEV